MNGRERENLAVAVWVAENFFKNTAGQKILEIGCGEGTLLKILSEKNSVWGVDISSSGVEKTKKKGIPCVLADASNETLPYEDGFFYAVITLETIEHVENPHRMLWEMKRVLKEGGTLLVSIPGERVYHPFIYPGLFTQKNFSEFLNSSACELKEVKGWGQAPLLAHWVERVRRRGGKLTNKIADMVFYVGRKRNLLMRKRLTTPLRWAYCLNFLCTNRKKKLSRVEEVAFATTPH